MPVDPKLPRKILVVHGVQTGDDDSLKQDQLIAELIHDRLGDLPLTFECDLYKYENLNDETLRKYKILLDLIVQNPIGQVLADAVLELVGDVVISLVPGGTADRIRTGLKERILAIYESATPCYIVAHSLGSIYAFDVINALIDEGSFDRASRRSWPVQGLLTIGSPIGLDIFRVTGRDRIASFGPGESWFRWQNIWDPNDPVVSGNIFGAHLTGNKIAERFISDAPAQGWTIHDIASDTGKNWLMAHTAYWQSSVVGDKLIDLIAS